MISIFEEISDAPGIRKILSAMSDEYGCSFCRIHLVVLHNAG